MGCNKCSPNHSLSLSLSLSLALSLSLSLSSQNSACVVLGAHIPAFIRENPRIPVNSIRPARLHNLLPGQRMAGRLRFHIWFCFCSDSASFQFLTSQVVCGEVRSVLRVPVWVRPLCPFRKGKDTRWCVPKTCHPIPPRTWTWKAMQCLINE